MPTLPPVTKALMLICVGMFCVGLLAPGPMIGWLALWPVKSGQFAPWQLLTYAFLHGGPIHLLFNMLGLWMFGSELERLWGDKRYLQFLLASTLAAAVVQLGWSELVGAGGPTIGASGALFGLLLAFGMLFPNRMIQLIFPPVPMKAKVYVAIFGGLELLMGLAGPDGVAHFAHLGGMLGGYLMLRYWRGQPPFTSKRR